MHRRGLNYYDLEYEDFLFVDTVAGNKKSYRERQIKADEKARKLYASIGCPLVKEYKWVIQSNQKNNFQGKLQGIYVANNIWGNSSQDCKVNTNRNKPIHLAGDLVQMPEDMVKLHRYIYLEVDLLFVNSTPFFVTLRSKICFTAVNHLANRKLENVFNSFKEIYRYYINHGFHIKTLHADGSLPHYNILYMRTRQEEPVSILQVQMNMPQILNAKS